jgi:hypothetical protein
VVGMRRVEHRASDTKKPQRPDERGPRTMCVNESRASFSYWSPEKLLQVSAGRPEIAGSEFKPRLGGVLGKHFHRVERQGGEVHAEHLGGLAEDVVRHGHDGATGLLSLKDV